MSFRRKTLTPAGWTLRLDDRELRVWWLPSHSDYTCPLEGEAVAWLDDPQKRANFLACVGDELLLMRVWNECGCLSHQAALCAPHAITSSNLATVFRRTRGIKRIGGNASDDPWIICKMLRRPNQPVLTAHLSCDPDVMFNGR